MHTEHGSARRQPRSISQRYFRESPKRIGQEAVGGASSIAGAVPRRKPSRDAAEAHTPRRGEAWPRSCAGTPSSVFRRFLVRLVKLCQGQTAAQIRVHLLETNT